jgi:hypothetical protein
MTGTGAERVAVELEGVPETTLWTLHRRAVEAARADAVIRDPPALSLVERIDLGQWQALRAMAFDREVRRFAAARPGGTNFALGEGLETGFWRADDGRMRWLRVDLPEVIALRERLLPPSPRRRHGLRRRPGPARRPQPGGAAGGRVGGLGRAALALGARRRRGARARRHPDRVGALRRRMLSIHRARFRT